MFKIGEFSKLAQISIRMLRYYDELDILKPSYIDQATKYRLYTADQLDAIQKITLLRDLGFSASAIKKALSSWDTESIRAKLCTRKKEILKNIVEEQEKIERLEFALAELDGADKRLTYDIKLKAVPDIPVLSLRKTVSDYYAEAGLWEMLDGYIQSSNLDLPKNVLYFSICHDEGYKESDVDLEVCVPIGKKTFAAKGEFVFRTVQGEVQMASLMVPGPYRYLAPAYKKIAYWLESNQNYRLIEISRQIYHVGPWNESDPEKYLTEIQMPLVSIDGT